MAVDVRIDTLRDLSMTERFGAIMGLKREVCVTGIEDTLGGDFTDFSVLLEALDNVNLKYSSIPVTNKPNPEKDLMNPRLQNLMLVERNVNLIPGDPDKAVVELVYEVAFGDAQNLDDPTIGGIIGSGKVSVQQIITDRLREDDDVLKADQGKQIIVFHKFPDGSNDFPNPDPDPDDSTTDFLEAHPKFAGKVKVKAVQINVFEPQETFVFKGISRRANPRTFVNSIVSRINSDTFNGTAKHTWLCTEGSYEPIDVGNIGEKPGVWLFGFEFQFNKKTWNPEATYIDEETGQPPPGLKKDKGIKQIVWQPEADFRTVLFKNKDTLDAVQVTQTA